MYFPVSDSLLSSFTSSDSSFLPTLSPSLLSSFFLLIFSFSLSCQETAARTFPFLANTRGITVSAPSLTINLLVLTPAPCLPSPPVSTSLLSFLPIIRASFSSGPGLSPSPPHSTVAVKLVQSPQTWVSARHQVVSTYQRRTNSGIARLRGF